MKFYNMARPLYLETDSSSMSLRDSLLKVRDGMNYRHDETVDNTILHLIAFTSKNLSSAEQCYSNIECKAFGILHG